MSAQLGIRVLGPLAVEVDGRPQELPKGRKGRSVLAWLALHPGVHSRAELAGRFWPDVLDTSARTSLRGELVEVRRVVSAAGDDWLVASRDGVGLRPDVFVDAMHFEELAAAGRERDALELCRGPLLAGLDDDWVYEERERNTRRRADLLKALATRSEDAGALDDAIELTRRRVELDGLVEDAHRDLIRYLAAAGDRAGALVVYERLREHLATELRIAPSAETRLLAEQLRSTHPPARRSTPSSEPRALPAALAGSVATAFGGRGTELGRLRAELAAARDGTRRFVLVEGEAGIGKTSLVAELSREAHAAGAAVLAGRCYEDPLLSYQPFAEAIRDAVRRGGAGLLTGAGSAAGELCRLIPDLGELAPGLPEPLHGNPEGERYRMFEAVVATLSAAGAQPPVVLVLEDLHWADKPTALLLSHVVRSTSAVPLLVVGTYRETDVDASAPIARALAEIRRDGAYERVRLGGLAAQHATVLVRAIAGGAAPARFVEAIHRRTAGNPFFVEEMVRHLVETGLVDPAAERWEPGSVTTVPEGVRQVVERRVERLDAGRGVLELAATVGPAFSLDVLEELCDEPRPALIAHLDAALGIGVIEEQADAPGRYVFAHALIRDALYSALSATRRAYFHLRVGEALERIHPDEGRIAGELARHFAAAGTADAEAKALHHSTRAAQEAMGRLAYEEAIAHYEAAEARAPDEDARCELLLALGDACAKAGDLAAARRHFAAAAEVAGALGAPESLARAALGFSRDWVVGAGAESEVIAILRAALEALGEGDPQLRSRLLGRLAMELYFGDQVQARLDLSAEAVAEARRSADDATRAFALNAAHWAQAATTHPSERLPIAREIVAAARDAGALELCLQGHSWTVFDLLELGHAEELDAEIAACVDLAERLRQPFYASWAAGLPAMRALMLGRFDEADALARAALARCRAVGNYNGMLASHVQIASCAENVGRLDDEIDALVAAVDELRPRWRGERPDARMRATIIIFMAAAGRLDEVRGLLDDFSPQTLARLAAIGERAVPAALIDACVALRDVERASILYDVLAPRDGLCFVAGRGVVFWGPASRGLGVLAATCGRPDAARRHLEAAVETSKRALSPPCIARAQYELGALLAEQGHYAQRAAALADAARATAERLGMRPLAAAARRLCLTARVSA